MALQVKGLLAHNDGENQLVFDIKAKDSIAIVTTPNIFSGMAIV
jgi:hypothetical protein